MSVVATVSEESFQNVAYVNNIPDNRQRQAWHTEASIRMLNYSFT
jgi:hypothetical protein